jgi:hypoxanthine phosphoribosyltransferase
MATTFRCDVISWAQVARLARRLAFEIADADYRPEVIVAIARGGYVPARLLADALGVMALSDMRIVHYGPGARRRRRARIVEPLSVPVAGRRVLVVDDVADRGDTYRLACRHIARRKPAAIRTAALHYKVGSRFVPDFYAAKLTAWRWINYPWARYEDIGGFIARMRPRPANVAAAARRLDREFGMRVPRAQVADALRLMATAPPAARRRK